MASVNKWIGIGNIGQDPTTRYMPNGEAVTNISLATTESWVDKSSGEKKQLTEWHKITFYRKLAEIVAQYCKKGSAIYVEGKLQTRKWTDKDNVERYTTEITADSMQLLGGRPDASEGHSEQQAPKQRPASPKKAAPQSGGDRFSDYSSDDVPF